MMPSVVGGLWVEEHETLRDEKMERKPKLRIYWDPDRTGETRLIPNPTGVLVPTRRFHLVVENTGEETARGCRGFIESLETLPGGVSASDSDLPGRLPLPWAGSGGRARIDIAPIEQGSPQRLHLLTVPMDSFFFRLASALDDASRPRQYAMGRYRMSVTVRCDNADGVSCQLLIEFSGSANSIKIQEVPVPSHR